MCWRDGSSLLGSIPSTRVWVSSVTLYLAFPSIPSKCYKPLTSIMRSQSLPAFIRLIQVNSTSAAFSILIISSIQIYTLMDHRDSFHDVFKGLAPRETPMASVSPQSFHCVPSSLIQTHRRPIPIKPARSSRITHSFHIFSQASI